MSANTIFKISAKHFRAANAFRSTDLDYQEMSKIHVKPYGQGTRIYALDGHKLVCCYDTTQQIEKEYSFTPTAEMIKAMNSKKAVGLQFLYNEETRQTLVFLDVKGAPSNVFPMVRDIHGETGALVESRAVDMEYFVDHEFKKREGNSFSHSTIGLSIKNTDAIKAIAGAYVVDFGEKCTDPLLCRFVDHPEIVVICMPVETYELDNMRRTWFDEFPIQGAYGHTFRAAV